MGHESFPSPAISPLNVKGFPSPAPLFFALLSLKTNAEVNIVKSDFLESAKAVEEAEPVNVDQFVKVCEDGEKVKV